MQIIALEAENLKRLVAVEIRPDSNLVQITGRNGQGKTSVLDAIWWALEGTKHIQAEPIRKGATSARITLDLGELIVTRKFNAKDDGGYTTSITVESAEGFRAPKPQTMLDALIGELSFDPLAFTRISPAEQAALLESFVPDFDFDKAEAADRADYDRRRDLNRQARELEAQAAGIELPETMPSERVSEDDLIGKINAALAHNTDQDELRRDKLRGEGHLAALRDRLAKLEEQVQQTKDEIKSTEADIAEIVVPERIDVLALQEALRAARQTNAVVTLREEKQRLEDRRDAVKAEAEALTQRMEDRAQARAKAIAAADIPVEGVTIIDRTVLLNGIPFNQASDAEQLRASVAIAAAKNPKLRVIRIRDGSLLDDNGMALLATFADEHRMQIWVERVASDGKTGFVIEDGRLKS